ncbi:Acyl- -binding domain-containing 5 [Brachionus plicatilis]|uniref:Acyl--binding domain-containing 5 n=1 Tax=Brachionus plicatilis TaxID=10195 RepID=A0A3M7P529_BRAPC|nr:Acyl- -binding domain-containing 5 [Brachionus plicatilis]
MSSLTLEERFNELCQIVQSLPKEGDIKLTNDDKLKFYSYYKQATEGPCDTPQPSIFKLVERAKWNAWNELGNLSKEDAMKSYINEMKNIISGLFASGELIERIKNLIEDQN